jgi:cell division protein FtsB
MDGKTKKILNYLKKNGGDADVLDVSFGLNMDEDFVQNALDSLVQENLVTETRNEQGKILYNLADGDAAPPPAPKKTSKKAAGKAVAGPEDHFDEFVLENEAVNVVTDTIVTHIDDISHRAAAPAPAPMPAPAAPPPPPMPAATAVFEVDDDFSPKPKKEKKSAPSPDIGIDDDDFSPKPKKWKKSAMPPDIGIDDDDFSPKPKKIKEKKATVVDDDTSYDDDNAGIKIKPQVKVIAAAAAAIVLFILAVFLSVAVSSGKTASAIAIVERDLIKTTSDLDTYKKETDDKIKALRARNQALETRIKSLENRSKQDRPAAAAAKKGTAGKKK